MSNSNGTGTGAPRRFRLFKSLYARRGRNNYGRVINNNVTLIKRNVLRTAISQTLTVDALGAWDFKLSDAPNYSEITAMFDEYRIKMVRMKFYPRYLPNEMLNSGTGTSASVTPRLFIAIDENDASTPSNINEIREYPNMKVYQTQQPIQFYLKPKISTAVYGSGVFSSYGQPKNIWLSSASPNVAHYGAKWAIDAQNTAVTGQLQIFDVEATYWIECRNPK